MQSELLGRFLNDVVVDRVGLYFVYVSKAVADSMNDLVESESRD